MKKLLLFWVTILTINCYSQISFEKGYYIDNIGKKTDCFIKNKDWAVNPIEFKYKTSDNDDIKTIGIESVQEFGIYNVTKYIRKKVKIEKSGESMNELNYDRNPVFHEEQLFLKVLVEGKANLYEGGNPNKFFYNVENSSIEQLIFISYKNTEDQIATNNQFKQQLLKSLACSTITMNELENLQYRKNSLTNIFNIYNKCSNSDFTDYEKKEKRDFFNLTLRPRLNNSSFNYLNEIVATKSNDFGKKISFGFGVEAEFILPINKNKWTILFEPTYQNFKKEIIDENSHPSGEKWTLVSTVNYTSIEIPFGIRHYFFLNKNSKIFINASFVFAFNLNSAIEYKSNTISSTLQDFDSVSNNFAYGVGCKLYDKYGLEMRYNATRNNFRNYLARSSEYKTISIIFGYSIF